MIALPWPSWVAIACLAAAPLGLLGWTAALRCAPAWLLDAGVAVAIWRAGLRRAWLEVDGQAWCYLDSGGDGEAVLLVHGYAANKESWLKLATRLRGQGYRLLLPDLPGFGMSPPAADADYSIPAQTQRLRDFVRALGAGPLHLVGHSMGGYVAGNYAASFAEDLASAYLVAPAGAEAGVPVLVQQRAASEGRNPLIVDSLESFRATMALAMVRPPRVPACLVQMIVERERPLRVLREIQADFWGSVPLSESLRGCEVPLRILWGERDRILPVASARALLAAMPSASLRLLPDVGHIPPLEAADELARDLVQFLSAHPAKGLFVRPGLSEPGR
ncbi:alpha/beta fold hydrolase [Pseudomonas sp. NBRC 100443]|uniref:alpha/beta fold hydrolase n=1 Tax=Pseudomonas sp. NBRC 100443 TaxID=1113665 RepID=UPI0024A392B2|nr:alpha/beta fold hydrolase [Pseudomonas sp. NBRC 100443]GLU37331.1 lipase [Pseudomonas sp. NBRC 100443]